MSFRVYINNVIPLTIAILLSMLLTLCDKQKYRGIEPHTTAILSTNIPIAGKDGETEIIETDLFKRELIKYETENVCVYLVCQGYDEDYVYFYEDFNFVITSSPVDIADQKIKQLKEINDWDKPICEEKISSKELHPSGTLSEYYWVEVSKLIKENIIGNQGLTYDFDAVDDDKNGKSLYFIYVINRIKSIKEYYFMILDEKGSHNEENYLVKVANIYNYQDQLHNLKEKNGWSFEKR